MPHALSWADLTAQLQQRRTRGHELSRDVNVVQKVGVMIKS